MDEIRAMVERSSELLLEVTVERKLRRDLAEAFRRLAKAAANVPGAHYAVTDGLEIVQEGEARDAAPAP